MANDLKTYNYSHLRELSVEQRNELEQLKDQDSKKRLELVYQPARAPRVSLPNAPDVQIPVMGLGTWKSKPGEVAAAVEAAIKAGYRHIDCAAIYGNESEVGEALSRVLKEGVVKRQELHITTKLWNSDHEANAVVAACKRSLKALQLEYVDLYLMHWPIAGNKGATVDPPIIETWRAMEGLKDEGLARAIGVSNFSIVKLQQLLEDARIKPAVNQVEVHPYWRNDALIEFCRQQGIHVTAYSPLGSPDSASMFKRVAPALMQDDVVQEVAKSAGKDVGQVLIKWGLQHGTSVIAKSTNPKRIQSNLDVFDFDLRPEEYQRLSSLELQCRMLNGAQFISPEGPYTNLATLWDDPEADTIQRRVVERNYVTDIHTDCATLNTGASMPLVGLGTWKSEPGQVQEAVAKALRLGYRHIDCAEVYKNEDEVGQAFSEVFAEGIVGRSDVFVTSKLWNSDHAKDKVEPALRKTLGALQLDHVDLYLMHWPVTGNVGPTVEPPLVETWAAMEACVDQGLTKAIGVSNFSVAKLKKLLSSCKIKPAVVQVEVHPYWRNDALIEFCRQQGIHVTAYSPLGSPDSASMFKRKAPLLMQDPLVKSIADKLGKSPAQVLIRWGLQHGTSVLPKSVNAERLKSNLDCSSWKLPEEDFKALSGLQYQRRMVDGSFWINEKGPYKSLQELWDEEEPVERGQPPADL